MVKKYLLKMYSKQKLFSPKIYQPLLWHCFWLKIFLSDFAKKCENAIFDKVISKLWINETFTCLTVNCKCNQLLSTRMWTFSIIFNVLRGLFICSWKLNFYQAQMLGRSSTNDFANPSFVESGNSSHFQSRCW